MTTRPDEVRPEADMKSPEVPAAPPLRRLRRVARARAIWAAQTLPRRRELRHPADYLHAVRLHRQLLKGGYTMTGPRHGRALRALSARLSNRGVPGDLVDCGVWNGGSTVMLADGSPGRTVWAFDSFEGLPEPGPLDGATGSWAGELQASEHKVREAFERFADASPLHVVKGWFEDTFPRAAPEVERVALLHADGDWYDSVKLTLETFYPKLSAGGYVVVDDYGLWEGARRATDEFRVAAGIEAPLVPVDANVVCWRKR